MAKKAEREMQGITRSSVNDEDDIEDWISSYSEENKEP